MDRRSECLGWLPRSPILPRSGTILLLVLLGPTNADVRAQASSLATATEDPDREDSQRRSVLARLFGRGSRKNSTPAMPKASLVGPATATEVPALPVATAPALSPLELLQVSAPGPAPAQDPSPANSNPSNAADGSDTPSSDATSSTPSGSSPEGDKLFNDLAKADPGQVEYPSFTARLFKAYFGKKEQQEEAASQVNTTRSGQPTFNTPPFPFAYHIGPNIGVNDTSVYPLMEAIYAGPNGQAWKDSRIKIYGWFDPSVNISTSKYSNVPLSYSIVPNRLQLSQLILIFERTVDSVQRDHTDWGFKVTNLYGIDFRYTTAKGYFSNQLLKHNHLYGYDPLQMYVDYYVPWIGEGTIYRFGRYISPIDIEAQLSPENYLYTHSLMYTYDPYTFTGLQQITKLNDQWQLTLGVHGGNDMAPWTKAAQPNGEILLKWVSRDGKDSLYGGIDSIGKGYYSHNHDDLQVLAGTWAHKFTDKFHTLTEAYYIWERSAQLGGTTTFGPPYRYFEGVGPGAKIPGLSSSYGIVNYTAYALSKKDYIVLRNDMLADPQGYRVGFKNAIYEEVTLGWIHHFTPWLTFRPEVRYDHSYGAKAYDNGTKANQWTASADVIFRF
jgi:hypothetical protein